MRKLLFLILAFHTLPTLNAADSGLKRYLYLSTPDGAQPGGSGNGILSLDGRYAWCHTPDVIDARTRKIVATLKDENGKPVCGSKFIEVHLRDGKVVDMGDQFGLGRAHLKVSAR